MKNAVLWEQLAAADCKPRFTDKQRRRLPRAAKGIPRRVLRKLGTIVTPDTLLRWYRRLVAKKYDGSQRRRHIGRPRIAYDFQSLIISIATKCRSWGYTRIRGVLQSLGITVSRSTIARVLREAGKSVDWPRGPSQARAPVVQMQGRRREHARRHVTDE